MIVLINSLYNSWNIAEFHSSIIFNRIGSLSVYSFDMKQIINNQIKTFLTADPVRQHMELLPFEPPAAHK